MRICAYLWEAFSARRFCVFRVFCGTFSPRLLVYERGSILPRNSRNPRNVRLRYWRRGYGRMPYPPNLCASVPICGRHFSARRFCVFRVFCGEFVHCFVGAALLVHLRQVHPLRVPPESAPSAIGFRSPSNRIAFAVRSDSVRHPIGLRSPSNQIPFAARCHK